MLLEVFTALVSSICSSEMFRFTKAHSHVSLGLKCGCADIILYVQFVFCVWGGSPGHPNGAFRNCSFF